MSTFGGKMAISMTAVDSLPLLYDGLFSGTQWLTSLSIHVIENK